MRWSASSSQAIPLGYDCKAPIADQADQPQCRPAPGQPSPQPEYERAAGVSVDVINRQSVANVSTYHAAWFRAWSKSVGSVASHCFFICRPRHKLTTGDTMWLVASTYYRQGPLSHTSCHMLLLFVHVSANNVKHDC